MRSDETQKQCLACRTTWAENPKKALDLKYERLFCTKCEVSHPLAYFSASERRRTGLDARKRTCIGHKGYVRLCQHEVITWEVLLSGKRRLHHQEQRHPNAPAVLLKQCLHPSHLPAHHGPVDGERHHPMVLLTLWDRDAVVLSMTWTGHLDLSNTQTPLSAKATTNFLRKLRRGAAEFLVPQAGPGVALPEMKYFDPNNCCCLDFGDKYPPNTRWSHHPGWRLRDPVVRDTYKCCRIDLSLRLIQPTAGDVGGDDERAVCVDTKSTYTHGTMTMMDMMSRGWNHGAYSGYFVEVKGRSAGRHCLAFTYPQYPLHYVQ